MLDDQDAQLIERKLEGILSEEDKLIFDQKYRSDLEFKQKVVSKTEVLASLEALKKEALKNEFKGWLTDDDSAINQEPSNRNIKWYLAVAAVILPLAIALTFIFQQSPKSSEELFVSYFEPLDNIVSSRSDVTDGDLNKGVLFYERGEYDSARYYLIKYPNDKNALIYLGISQLALGNTQQSIASFQKVKTFDVNQSIQDYMDWYIALAHLKAEDIEATKSTLETFKQRPSSDYHDKAVNLLEEL